MLKWQLSSAVICIGEILNYMETLNMKAYQVLSLASFLCSARADVCCLCLTTILLWLLSKTAAEWMFIYFQLVFHRSGDAKLHCLQFWSQCKMQHNFKSIILILLFKFCLYRKTVQRWKLTQNTTLFTDKVSPYASDLNGIFKDKTKYVRLSIWFYRHLLQKTGDWRRGSRIMFWSIFIEVFCEDAKRGPLEIPPLCSCHQNQFSLSPGGFRLFIWKLSL